MWLRLGLVLLGCESVLSTRTFKPDNTQFRLKFSAHENEGKDHHHDHCQILEAGWTSQGSRLTKKGNPFLKKAPEVREDPLNAPCLSEHVKGSFVNKPCDKNQHHHHFTKKTVYELFTTTKIEAFATLFSHCRSHTDAQLTQNVTKINSDDVEIKLLRTTGPSTNRIDVVLMGDGYTLQERDLFFEEMERLTQDMFTDVTFASFLPVFNIWALHVPSEESGIGIGGRPRDTAFRLYRDGTELRGIYTANSQGAIDACKLTGADACDYPSIIGNDDFYGGLGGTFVIGTKSITTGTVVLRHEMGHNFGNVGEGYDGGSVYRGVNSAPSASQVGWSAWLSAPNKVAVEERSAIRLEEYPWYDLANGPIEFTLTSDGDFRRWMLRFTASGCEEQGSLRAFLDGRELELRAPGYMDRAFYTLEEFSKGFAPGRHTLRFEQGMPPKAGAPIRQLCSLVMHEYMEEGLGGYHFNNSYISAYPTWDIRGTKRVRPMNEYDLMRNMSSARFGPVMLEGIWMQFLAKVELVDDVEVSTLRGTATVTAHTLPLGQKRAGIVGSTKGGNQKHIHGTRRTEPEQIAFYGSHVHEVLEVRWYQQSGGSYRHRPELDGLYSFDTDASKAAGNWRVRVKFVTDEIRADPNGLTESTVNFII